MTGSYAYQEILFFDTFLHEKPDALNLDHVKFKYPVYIDEIRVVPKSCDINVSTHHIIGETYPLTFKIEIFGNNLNRALNERATFDKIGGLNYKYDEENVLKPKSIPVDWLVIKGPYTALTLVVIGVKAKQSDVRDIQQPQMQHHRIQFENSFNTPATPHPRLSAGLLPTPTNSFLSPISYNQNQYNGVNVNTTPQQQQQHDHSNFRQPDYVRFPNEFHHQHNINQNLAPIRPNIQMPPQQQIRTTTFNQQQHNIKQLDLDSQQQQHEVVHHNRPFRQQQHSESDEKKLTEDTNKSQNDTEMKTESNTSISESADNSELNLNGSSTALNEEVDDELEDLQLYYSQIGLDDDYPSDYNELANYSLSNFNPYQFEIPKKLPKIRNPTLNTYEQQLQSTPKPDKLSKLSEKLLELLLSTVNDHQQNDTWLQQCEKLFSSTTIINSFIEIKQTNEETFNKLINYLIELTSELLNYKNLIKTTKFKEQIKQMFKIRQIKFSLTLISLLTSQLDEDISKKLLNKQIQIKLIQLFENESIYMSLKIAILKTLDSTLCFPSGIKEFLGGEYAQNGETTVVNEECGEESIATATAAAATTTKTSKTAYTRLLMIFIGKKCTTPSRINSLIGKLLNKLMFFNLLNRFQVKINSLISINSSIDQFTPEHYKLINELYDLFALFYFIWKNQHQQLAQNENIIKKLPVKILFVNQMLTKEQELFMIQRVFGHYDLNDACLTFFYRLVSHFNIFKSIILLWSHPIVTQIRVDFLQIIEKFFNDMLYSTESLNYLLVNSKQTTALVKLMLKKSSQQQGNINSTNLDEIIQLTGNSSLTNQILYSLQTLIYINNLNEFDIQQKFDFYYQNLNILQSLSMFLTNLNTKLSLVNVFTLSSNIVCLLDLLKIIYDDQNNENINENQLKKLLVSSIIEIIHTVFKHNDSNMNFYKNNAGRIHEVLSLYILKDDQDGFKSIQEKLKQINEYLAPHLKLKSYSYECIGYLIKNLKLFTTENENSTVSIANINNDNNEASSSNLNAILCSKTLIQILRLINYLCVSPSDDDDKTTSDAHKYEILSEFNYKRCLGELLSQQNCLDELLYFIKKLSEYILYTYQNCILLSLNDKHQIFTILKLCIQLTHEILKTHIDIRKNKFNNLTCLKHLFSLYNSIHLTFQLDQIYEDVINSLKTSIINIFTLFMQQEKETTDIEESSSSSSILLTNKSIIYNDNLYKCLFRELCKFIVDSPYNYIGGLIIFLELLPLPLPIICTYDENNQKLTDTIKNERLILDFNLDLVLSQLRAVIRILALSTNVQLQQIFKRFCVHLADISSNMCLFVVKTLLDEIIEQINSKEQETTIEQQQQQMSIDGLIINYNILWPIDVARLITILTSLLTNSTNSSIKYGFLYLIKLHKQHDNEKYRLLLTSMINYCINATRLSTELIDDNQAHQIQHLLIQESIFYLIQVLCDNNTLYDDDETTTTVASKQHHLNLFKQLPDYELLKQIVKLLIDHLHSTKLQTIQMTMSVLNALILLCRHDYGYEMVISVLNNHSNTIYNFLNEFNLILINRQQSLYDLVNLLTVFYEFIRLLVPPVTQSGITISPSLPNLTSMETEDNSTNGEKQAITRTSHISQKKFSEIIKWNSNTKDHPLLKLVILLENLLKSTSNTEANTQLNDLQNDATSLINHLRNTDTNLNENEKFLFLNSLNNYKFIEKLPDEIVYVDSESLDSYYSHRLVYLVDESINGYFDIERYLNEWTNSVYEGGYDDVIDNTTTTTTIATAAAAAAAVNGSQNSSSTTSVNQSPQLNEGQQQQFNTTNSSISSNDNLQFDKIEVDLDEIIKTYCPNFDLTLELNKEFSDVVGDKQMIKKSVKQPEVINTRTGFRYKAPMRGGHNPGMRGSATFNSYMTGYRADAFRSRQPNTSRPPSVHVDDFYRLQAQELAAKMNNPGAHAMSQPENVDDDWQRSRQFQQSPQFMRNSVGGTVQTNPALNSRSRFMMPPGTYSVNNTQLRDRIMQNNGEFLSPLPPSLQQTQQIMPQNQRFQRLPISLDRRNSFPNLDQNEDHQMNNRQLQPPPPFNPHLRFTQFPNNPMMRPGFRNPTNYIQRRMPTSAYMRSTTFPR